MIRRSALFSVFAAAFALWAVEGAAQTRSLCTTGSPFVQSLAASSLGACSREGCDASEESAQASCPTQTQACAARVVERIGEAAIASLRAPVRRPQGDAGGSEMQGLRDCLAEARAQLETGARGLDESGGTSEEIWLARRDIGLTVARKLIDELDAELNALSDENLRIELDAWFVRKLAQRRAEFSYEGVGERTDTCPSLRDPPEAWAALDGDLPRVDCMLQGIAAERVNNADDGLEKRAGIAAPLTTPRSCVLEDGGVDPACCMASPEQRRDKEAPLGFYDFPRGELTFRGEMEAFCRAAESAGLIDDEGRLKQDENLPTIEAVLRKKPEPEITPEEVRRLAAHLAASEERVQVWRDAREQAERRSGEIGVALEEELKKLDAYFEANSDPERRNYLLERGPDWLNDLNKRMLYCLQDKADPLCRRKESLQ